MGILFLYSKKEDKKIAAIQVKRSIAGTHDKLPIQNTVPPKETTTELKGLDTIKNKLIDEITKELEAESKREGREYTRCVPKYKSDCAMLCVNDFGDPITCEITRIEETYNTICRIGAENCEETTESRLVEKIISSRKIIQSENGVCITKQKYCQENSPQEQVSSSDFKTLLTPSQEIDYYEKIKSHRLSQFLYNSHKKMDYLNEFGDCVLEGVPAEAHLEDLEKFVSESTLKSCLGSLLKAAKE